MPAPPDPAPPDPVSGDAPPPTSARDEGEPLPPLPPFYKPSAEEQRPLPRGCHPLVFGIVMATLQFAATLYFMPSCFHGGPG